MATQSNNLSSIRAPFKDRDGDRGLPDGSMSATAGRLRCARHLATSPTPKGAPTMNSSPVNAPVGEVTGRPSYLDAVFRIRYRRQICRGSAHDKAQTQTSTP